MEKKSKLKNNPQNPKPIVITERDKAVLVKIADYRILTTEQLYRLCFPSFGRARKRLSQLWIHGYLKRIIRPTRMGEGSSMYLYLPSRRGLQLISSSHLIKQLPTSRSSFHTDHTLAINNFRACLELSTRTQKETSIGLWKEGKELLIKTAVKSGTGIVRHISIIPDAYFTLKHYERIFHYFLEIDRSTTDLKRIAQKCRCYLNIWQEKTAQAKFGLRSFRVLYVTVGEKRLSNMIALLPKFMTYHRRPDIIFMTDTSAYSLTRPDKLLEPIWKIVDSRGDIRETGMLPDTSLQSSRRRAENHHCAVQNPMSTNGNPGPGG